MRIINISHTVVGGAGIAVSRTHKRLLSLGYKSVLFTMSDNIPEEYIYAIKNSGINEKQHTKTYLFKKKIVRRIKSLLRISSRSTTKSMVGRSEYCFFSDSEQDTLSVQPILDFLKADDIVIFYWVGGGMLNSKNMLEIKEKTVQKMFWYGLDMAPITGGCHYFWNCRGYTLNCSDCPALIPDENDFAALQHEIKKKNLSKLPLTLLASSDIGIEHFKPASIKFDRYYKMPYAIDTDIFTIIPNTRDPNTFRIFFNAQNINDIRKGWAYFKEIILLADKKLTETGHPHKVQLLSVYYNDHSANISLNHIELIDLAFADSEESLAGFYQSSDLFICTSIEDLSPLMVNEALLCGVPVLSFMNASNPEYIINGQNGWMTEPGEIFSMSEILVKIITGNIKFNDPYAIRKTVLPLHEAASWNNYFKELIISDADHN